MADVFSNDLRLRLQESGSNSGQWGSLLNDTITNIASAFSLGSEAIPNASTHTITLADDSSSQDEARSLFLKCTGGGQACTVTLAPNTVSKVWIISNETSFTLTFSAGSGANVAVSAGAVKVIVTDGAGSSAAVTDALSGLDASLSGLTVDTTTLVVDATNNRVGVGVASPSVALQVSGQIKNNNGYLIDNGTNAGFLTVDGSNVNFGSSTAAKGLAFFTAATSQAMTIDSSARVGIGISNPTEKFTVVNSSSGIVGRFTNNTNQTLDLGVISGSGAAGGVYFNNANSGYHAFQIGGTERMRLTATGLGIGISSPSDVLHAVGPTINLERQSNGAGFGAGLKFSLGDSASTTANHNYASIFGVIEDNTNGAEDGYLSFQTSLSGSLGERLRIHSSGNTFLQTGGAALQWQNGYQTITGDAASNDLTYRTYQNHIWKNTTGASSTTDGTEVMRISGSNVGIGRTNPSSYVTDNTSLYVKGQIRVDGVTNTAAVPALTLNDTNSGLFAPAANAIAISTGAAERIRIGSSGTTSLFSGTSNTLELNTSSNSAGTNNLIRGFSDSDINGGGTVRFVVFPSGNVQNSNNSYGAISDQKLKENIADAGSQWDDIKAIRVRKYSLIADSETTANRLGVIAQELEASGMSGLVEEYTDLGLNNEDLGTTTKGVKYSVLYMKAIKALQEAMTKIEDLETRITQLENN